MMHLINKSNAFTEPTGASDPKLKSNAMTGMMNPRVTVNRQKLYENLVYLTEYLNARGIEVAAVTKAFSAWPELMEIYDSVENIRWYADARLENFVDYPTSSVKERLLLRIPMISEAPQVIRQADISLNSEIETIRTLNEVGAQIDITHKIILMIDFGDLREGIFDDRELFEYVGEIKEMSHINLCGIGTNLTCYGGVLPTTEILQRMVDYRDALEKEFDIEIELISGGNSSSLYLLEEGQGFPEGVNMLRIGEAYILGIETAHGQPIPHMHQDAFTLFGEIIEYRDKPSMPIGETGLNAFGDKPTFVDRGIMKRGIIALGKQDVDHTKITPVDPRLEVIGSSSDHMIIDFTKAADDYALGGEVAFKMGYGSLLAVFTSKYIKKYII